MPDRASRNGGWYLTSATYHLLQFYRCGKGEFFTKWGIFHFKMGVSDGHGSCALDFVLSIC